MTSLLLFPGAGAGRDNPCLVAIENAATAEIPKLKAVRADFPYRKAGRRAPDRPPVLLQAVRDEANALGRGKLFLGGRSMGGRICSIAVGDEEAPLKAAGLVLIAYPLHPPGKPDRLRVEHFPRLDVPCLFVSGTRDPFGTPDEMTEWTATIPGPVEHVWIEGGGHDLRGADSKVAAAVIDWMRRRLR